MLAVLFGGPSELAYADAMPPLARLERLVDGDPRHSCPVTFVADLGAVTARHCLGSSSVPLWVRRGEDRWPVVAARVPGARAVDDAGRLVAPQHDWALLTLEGDPPPPDVRYVGRAGLALAGTGAELTKLGPGRAATAAPRRGACQMLPDAAAGRVFRFRCEKGVGPGRSGSPILAETEVGWILVGVHIAISGKDPDVVGIAVLPSLDDTVVVPWEEQ
ncbi:MAG: hypothetical protein AAFX81_11795 [Pseudomonadota bacterium]